MIVLLLISGLFLPAASPAMCYQCASELALINWSRYGLPPMQGDSMMADDACLDDSSLSGHVPCSAPCMTINITAVGGKHDGRVIGIVRDCQTYFRSPKALPEGTDRICRHSVRDTVRNHRINVTFCYCNGHLCNGMAPQVQLRRLAQRRHPRLPNASMPCRALSLKLAMVAVWLLI
uniref:Protein quiver n=1 Tax=Haemonchus contortus TaxID=6289 RepID=A0A7I4YWG9_HAECO